MKSESAARLAAGAIAAVVAASCMAANAEMPAASPDIAPLVAPDLRWTLRQPKEDKVIYHGIASFDGVGVAGLNMLYPAPNVAVGLIALLTHGIVTEAGKKAQKDKLQEAADKVMLPYQAVLSDYTYRDLMQRGLEKMATGSTRQLVAFAQKAETEWYVDSMPVFAMTQDESALVVQNVVAIYAPGPPQSVPHVVSIKVVSAVNTATDLRDYWVSDNGRNLKDESAVLFAESLDLALQDAVTAPAGNGDVYTTIRYREGGAEKMERGQLLDERCNRIVLRTLRGGLMSVPSSKTPEAGESNGACVRTIAIPK